MLAARHRGARRRSSVAVCLALLAVALSPFLVTLVQSQTATACALVEKKTLATNCYDACAAGQLCMAGATATSKCNCFTATSDSGVVVFLVPFNASTTAKLLASESAALVISDDTSTFAHASNDELSAIDQWTLPANATEIYVVGGNEMLGRLKGFVASLDIAVDFVGGQNQIEGLTLVNLELRQPLAQMATYFPASLTKLDLSNTFLTEIPAPITKLTKLTTLLLNYNDITNVASSVAMQNVSILSLGGNKISSFTAVYPSLVSLSLSNNNFQSFPQAIFRHTNLKQLYIASNTKMQNVTFTLEQAKFLDQLTDFKIDKTTLQSGCTNIYTSTTGYVFCVSATAANDSSSTVASDSSSSTAAPVSDNSSAPGRTTSTDTKSSSDSSNTPVIIGCVAGVILVGVITLFVIVSRSRKLREKPSTATLTAPSAQIVAGGSDNSGKSLWNDQELLALKVSVDDIQDVEKIGAGAFADVWLVKFHKNQLMASKRLRGDAVTREQIQAFINEIKLVSTLKHPAIVEFMGVAWVRESDLQALFEYIDNGDLRTYLISPGISTKWSSEKLQIAIDVAEALVYVHSFLPPLVHRDLKSRNVLLNSEMRAKLTDFGVSRYWSNQNTMTAGVGTGRWLAPEVISGDGSYGTAADLFSFGVLLSELDTHELPYHDVRGANGNQLADVALLQSVAIGELLPSFSFASPETIQALAMRCLSLDPRQRPSAVQVSYELRSYRNVRFDNESGIQQ